LNKAIVLIAGTASLMEVGHLRTVAEQSQAFRTMLIWSEQTLFAQVQQTAACNASHSVEARLARWLLRARDVAHSDTLPLTQEFLAQMLGVRRSSVSGVATAFQQAGLISYDRGLIQIANAEGLRKACCECYEIIDAHYDRLLSDLAK
jgi:CRP-like cAMP-binding protein